LNKALHRAFTSLCRANEVFDARNNEMFQTTAYYVFTQPRPEAAIDFSPFRTLDDPPVRTQRNHVRSFVGELKRWMRVTAPVSTGRSVDYVRASPEPLADT